MAKNLIRIFLKKIYKKLKKAHLKCTFVRALRFRGKKPQELCTLRLSALLTTLETLECKIQTPQTSEGKSNV